jgi:hypothetical protein
MSTTPSRVGFATHNRGKDSASCVKFARNLAASALATFMISSISLAAEPRPWLCRNIPVFSDTKPMTWHATQRGGGHWLMAFMHYDPAGGHDGFTVISTSDISGTASGALDPGHWYAVALYRASGHWICPGNASESNDSAAGTISSLCYGESDDACDLKFVVKPASP